MKLRERNMEIDGGFHLLALEVPNYLLIACWRSAWEPGCDSSRMLHGENPVKNNGKKYILLALSLV